MCAGHYKKKKKYGVTATVCTMFYCNNFLPHTYEYNFQSQNTSALSNIPNNRTVNSPTVLDALSNQSSKLLDI
jgi:hypothetical protein